MLVTEFLLVTYLNYGDPEHSARPHPLICPDLVSELDILDCDVVPGQVRSGEDNFIKTKISLIYLSERPANVSPSKTWWSRNDVQHELPEEQVP